ncbi:MAG: hypothetical protein J6T94_04035 [Bacteroidaceae bacterium]|nr:hypothetical protein [Bacteroidaceae bacterium]MBP5323631.1 hypothetical protein [Bacteroidaceae bacterium]
MKRRVRLTESDLYGILSRFHFDKAVCERDLDPYLGKDRKVLYLMDIEIKGGDVN